MTSSDIYNELKRDFEPEALRELDKGNVKLTYVPVSEVIARLNNTLGVNGWSITSSEAWRDELNPEWVLAKVELQATVDGVDCVRIGWGGQKVKRPDNPLDLGDEFKGATSDALKKAAQALGVGLSLARDEDMLAIEREAGMEKISYDQKRFLQNYIDSLESKEELAQWFKDVLPGKSLSKGNVTVEDFNLILQVHSLWDAWNEQNGSTS